MNRSRRRWYSWLVDLAVRIAPDRPGQQERRERLQRASFDTDVSRWPLRLTEFLRDRLRPQWLRLRKEPPPD